MAIKAILCLAFVAMAFGQGQMDTQGNMGAQTESGTFLYGGVLAGVVSVLCEVCNQLGQGRHRPSRPLNHVMAVAFGWVVG